MFTSYINMADIRICETEATLAPLIRYRDINDRTIRDIKKFWEELNRLLSLERNHCTLFNLTELSVI
jgi:hypothetical protein